MNLLFVGFDPNRDDLKKVTSGCRKKAKCFFLESFEVEENLETGQLAWSNYKSAFHLLEETAPDKVIFVLLDNYFHFALFLACKQLGIHTIYLDHGIRFRSELNNIKDIDTSRLNPVKNILTKIPFLFYIVIIKNHFLANTLNKLLPPFKRLLRRLIKERFRYPFGMFMDRNGKEIIPDHFIIYSQETFLFYQDFFALPPGFNEYTLTGIPAADFATQIIPSLKGNTILLIDQGLHEQNLFGWTRENKIAFLIALKNELEEMGLSLAIKPHPKNERYYSSISPTLVVINNLDKGYIEENIIGVTSFNSTLLLGFCAIPCLITFTLETHPIKPRTPFSYDITKFKTAIPIFNLTELSNLLTNRHQFFEQKKMNIPNFIAQMLYKFDGLAQQRITNAILNY